MRLTEQRRGLRMLKLRAVSSRFEAAEFCQLEAVERLGGAGLRLRRALPAREACGGLWVLR